MKNGKLSSSSGAPGFGGPRWTGGKPLPSQTACSDNPWARFMTRWPLAFVARHQCQYSIRQKRSTFHRPFQQTRGIQMWLLSDIAPAWSSSIAARSHSRADIAASPK